MSYVERGQRRGLSVVTVACGLGLLAVGVVLIIRHLPNELQKADSTASVVAGLIACGGAGIALLGWSVDRRRAALAPLSPEALEHAASALAGAVRRQWVEEARIRVLGDPGPMPVRWRLADSAMMDETNSALKTVAGTSDAPAEFAEKFLSMSRPRMVICGGPGSGKTTLAVQLVLALLALRDREHASRVPVLLSIAAWEPREAPHLQDFLCAQLDLVYPALKNIHPGVVDELVASGQVLAVLDGLDEMPVSRQRRILDALNESLYEHDGIILTCRSEEYKRLVGESGDRLTGAAVVVPSPLVTDEVCAYLKRLLHEPGNASATGDPERIYAKRMAFLSRLQRGEYPELARVTSTPLNVWMLRSVYFESGLDLKSFPVFRSPSRIYAHLLEELIPALVRLRPPQGRTLSLRRKVAGRPSRRYEPEYLRRVLTVMATQMVLPGEERSLNSDWKWWEFASFIFGRGGKAPREASTEQRARGIRWLLTPRVSTARLFTGLIAIAFAIFVGTITGLVVASLASFLVGWQLFGIGAGVATGVAVASIGVPMFITAVGIIALVRCGKRGIPARLHVRFAGRVPELLDKLRGPVCCGLLLGLLLGSLLALIQDVDVAFTSSLVFGLTVGLAVGTTRFVRQDDEDDPAESPFRSFRRDCTYTIFSSIFGGLLLSCCLGVFTGLAVALTLGVLSGVVTGLLTAVSATFTIGLVLGFAIWSVNSPSYMFLLSGLGAGLLHPRNFAFSLRMMRVLRDCHQLGLLRAVGPIYQFRHSELHSFLLGFSGEGVETMREVEVSH